MLTDIGHFNTTLEEYKAFLGGTSDYITKDDFDHGRIIEKD